MSALDVPRNEAIRAELKRNSKANPDIKSWEEQSAALMAENTEEIKKLKKKADSIYKAASEGADENTLAKQLDEMFNDFVGISDEALFRTLGKAATSVGTKVAFKVASIFADYLDPNDAGAVGDDTDPLYAEKVVALEKMNEDLLLGMVGGDSRVDRPKGTGGSSGSF